LRRCIDHGLTQDKEKQFTPKPCDLDYVEKNIPESNKGTEQNSTNDCLSFQSSDSIDSHDTSTKTISAENGANDADNEAIVNTGHTAEHDVKAALDNVNAIQNAHISFNLVWTYYSKYTFKMQNISNLILAWISKLENDALGYYQKSPSKKLTKTHVTTKILDKNFSKDTCTVHPSTIPFLTNIMVNYENHLRPYVVPVNHNSLNEAKALNIAHTMLGNFCHGDKDKESHMENMGNDACVVVGFKTWWEYNSIYFFSTIQQYH
jgi:hypothetical protein